MHKIFTNSPKDQIKQINCCNSFCFYFSMQTDPAFMFYPVAKSCWLKKYVKILIKKEISINL